jgi:hypothetical protein
MNVLHVPDRNPAVISPFKVSVWEQANDLRHVQIHDCMTVERAAPYGSSGTALLLMRINNQCRIAAHSRFG